MEQIKSSSSSSSVTIEIIVSFLRKNQIILEKEFDSKVDKPEFIKQIFKELTTAEQQQL